MKEMGCKRKRIVNGKKFVIFASLLSVCMSQLWAPTSDIQTGLYSDLIAIICAFVGIVLIVAYDEIV